MNIKISFFLLLLSSLVSFNSANKNPFKHRCQFEKHKVKKIMISTSKKQHFEVISSNNNSYSNSSYGSLRVLVDYSNMNVTNSIYKKIKSNIIPKIILVLNKYFEINRTISLLKFPSTYCVDAKIPKIHQTLGIKNVDLVLYISAENDESSDYVAWAASCFLDEETGRPVAAQININLYYLQNETYSLITSTIFHELLHVLGFDVDLFDKFIYPNGTKIPIKSFFQVSEPNNLLKIPELVEMAKAQFGCETMIGVPLEKGMGSGSDDSHWAEEFFEQELMAPVQGLNEVISNFTLAFFNHTGWYKVRYNNRSSMSWGRNKGCNFVNRQCDGQTESYGEFCTNIASKGCTPDGRFVSVCWNSESEKHCPLNFESTYCSVPTTEFNLTDYEYFGNIQTSGSKCFHTDISLSDFYWSYATTHNDAGYRCLQASCILNEKGEKILNVSFHNYTMQCNESNVWISASTDSGYAGILFCPNIKEFCEIYPVQCPKGCNGNGLCVDGVCDCFDFIRGKDCNNLGRLFNFTGTGLGTNMTEYKEQYFS